MKKESYMNERIFRDAGFLEKRLQKLRVDRGPLVLANGCFDILHVGHVRYLVDAAALGGILVVALNDDASTHKLKGEGRPAVPVDERAEILIALEPVDYVLIFADETVDSIIEVLRPDFHAKGTDYTVETVPERDAAKAIGCRTVIVGDPKNHSSRDMIGRIRGEGKCGS